MSTPEDRLRQNMHRVYDKDRRDKHRDERRDDYIGFGSSSTVFGLAPTGTLVPSASPFEPYHLLVPSPIPTSRRPTARSRSYGMFEPTAPPYGSSSMYVDSDHVPAALAARGVAPCYRPASGTYARSPYPETFTYPLGYGMSYTPASVSYTPASISYGLTPPIRYRCKVPSCLENHEHHLCHSCQDYDSTHMQHDCPRKRYF
ncbi:MAG: hypothetical protein Gaeavirus29_2 [Gaeavirus sp.]|uniref:Uncharacterized protein n=1 Tax=Gaeavirus sp. TaxID=2487767 RepID=A0A3G4ZZH3_9VIRU|nr:MAG: hypothetical protein Gaeavirus29_2 [Gaeavirus sp.]